MKSGITFVVILTMLAVTAPLASRQQAESKAAVFRIGGGVDMPAEHLSFSVPANRQ